LDRSAILNTSLPATGVEISTWNSVVASHKAEILYEAMTDAISALDHVVGACLGLTGEDVSEIQRDLQIDAFLKGVRPRYPGTVTRKQGFRTGLDSEERYA